MAPEESQIYQVRGARGCQDDQNRLSPGSILGQSALYLPAGQRSRPGEGEIRKCGILFHMEISS